MGTSLREQLQSIYEDRQVLDADTLVEVATPDEHPLHDRFEWDDSLAGHEYRREQARRLIRSCRIVYRDDTAPQSSVRAFQHVKRGDVNTYVPTEEVAADPIATELVRRQMRREWLQMKNRYMHFAEFTEMVRGDMTQADVG